MFKKILIILVCLLTQAGLLFAADVSPEADAMLRSAESLFIAMQQKEYAGIWEHLSQKSKHTIADDTLKAVSAKQINITLGAINEDFAAGKEISQAYWDSFMKSFNPIIILEQSKWEIAKMQGDQAQIKITYRKAEKPAFLKMYKEESVWKVGLTETFWANKSRLK